MNHILLNIGSNMGDRRALMARAVALLRSRLQPARMLVSDPVESKPDGFVSPSPFLNIAVLALRVSISDPLEVLAITQSIEQEVGGGIPHRNPDGSYRDRPIDIDIIDIDHIHLSSPSLTLPHPRAHLRPFVIIPTTQIAPELAHHLTTK
ncbi:MAG: 2-amino-4-hydroxy-6-hydroxymethyldihydropteridine diphosphokinase [Muribaculaceae bacterium]